MGNPIVIKHVVQEHQNKVMMSIDDEDLQRVHVRRAFLFEDAMRQFSKVSFNPSKFLRVVFIGEQAVDEGGPRRELFRLLMTECFTRSGLFTGFPDHVVPIHNVDALTVGKFHTIGKIIATCIVQGGQPPVCFAEAVADYLVYDQVKSAVCIDDISDVEVRNSLTKVCMIVV